ncbi:hypothetical protein AAE02nite_17870 [Adhaeribacter aerolatus]|uniref:Lipocalin-like domain-containing protein n=2 Tax=Adhaeribacter aerolatus TaxID=670289 RepID=A0A512AWM6_9BACT|nr:hypothetical protein AAE02nite_17870 [Adhaeribacter aerolatus]
MHPDQKNFESGDWYDGTNAEYKQEASTYIAFSGPYQVDENKHTLTHSMFVSFSDLDRSNPTPGSRAAVINKRIIGHDRE